MRLRRPTLLLLALFGTGLVTAARAEDVKEIAVIYLGDRFDPAEVAVPAAVKFVLRVENKSTTAMEWESRSLHREKVVAPGTSAKINMGPLTAGSYDFFDDFHPKIKGKLAAQ